MNSSIFFWSHACVQIKSCTTSFLFDPWIFQQPVFNLTTWKYPDVSDNPSDLGRLYSSDFVIITHTHEDHFHIPSLDSFNRAQPIIIPSFDEHKTPRKNLIKRTLQRMNFANIIELDSWNKTRITDQVFITRIPSAQTRDHDWENSSYLIDDFKNEISYLNMNDNVSDKELLSQIKSILPPHKLCLLVQAGGVTMYPGLFKMSEAEMYSAAKQRREDFPDQKLQLQELVPDFVVPFAADFCWLDDRLFHCNITNKSDPYLFHQMAQFIKYEGQVVMLEPGDEWFLTKPWENRPYSWEEKKLNLELMKNKYAERLNYIHDFINSEKVADIIERTQRRVDKQKSLMVGTEIDFIAHLAYCILDSQGEASFYINYVFTLGNLDIRISFSMEPGTDIILYLEEHIWSSVLTGKLMQNITQWSGMHQHITPFRRDIGKAWFWIEYFTDLNNRNIQMHLNADLIEATSFEPIDVLRGVAQ